MDAIHFDTLTRAFDARSRRRLLGAFSAAAVALGPLAFLSDVEAKKRRKKKKKKKGQSCPPPPSCAETCPSICAFCFTRSGAGTPLVCGNSPGIDCNSPCSSHDDCAGTDHPYCIAQRVSRSTGEVLNMCEPDPVGGFCSQVSACD